MKLILIRNPPVYQYKELVEQMRKKLYGFLLSHGSCFRQFNEGLPETLSGYWIIMLANTDDKDLGSKIKKKYDSRTSLITIENDDNFIRTLVGTMMTEAPDHVLQLDPSSLENQFMTQPFIDKSLEWHAMNIRPIFQRRPRVPHLTRWAIQNRFMKEGESLTLSNVEIREYINDLLQAADAAGIVVSQTTKKLFRNAVVAKNYTRYINAECGLNNL